MSNCYSQGQEGTMLLKITENQLREMKEYPTERNDANSLKSNCKSKHFGNREGIT